MAIDLTQLKPVELARILNSTKLGECVSQASIYRQQNRAGLKVGDGKQLHLIKYAAWIFSEWKASYDTIHNPKMTSAQMHRQREAERQRRLSESVREIGELSPVVDEKRRERCKYDLRDFIMTYAPEGKAPFSDDHLRVIHRIENAVFNGGRFIIAMPRGSGKTTISELAAVWVALYGHKRFILFVGASQPKANDNLDSIKGILESDLLLEDFPEICFPIRSLDGIAQRAHGQIFRGKPTHIEWGSTLVVLPMLSDIQSDGAGTVIMTAGITSKSIRGSKHRRGDGIQLRPDFAIVDDCQDDESAGSPVQIEKRIKIIQKAILRSAGHMSGISAVMPCTVICKDDMADQLLDPMRHQAWQGERIPFVRRMPDKLEELWLGDYARIRNTYNADDPEDQYRARKEAREFYKAHKEEMDAGGVVYWAHCFNPDEYEISSLQHAMNALIDDGEDVFQSEFQNEPLLAPEDEGQLTRNEILAKLNKMKRGVIPERCNTLTSFIDVQGKCLYYLVAAWEDNFTGYIVDYGCYPDQRKNYFTLRQIAYTLQGEFPGTGQEGCWRAGLEVLTKKLLGKEWKRADAVPIRISRCLIDANDGNAAGTIYDFCRQSDYAAVVMPSRGIGVTASSLPFQDYRKRPGDKLSEFNWRIPRPPTRNIPRSIYADVNHWKSFVRSRLRVPMGDIGNLSIYGKDEEKQRGLVDHLLSEYSIRTEGRGRVVDEWAVRPGHSENHWWDCLVGCAVAASEQGVILPGTGIDRNRKKKKKNRMKLSEIQAKRKGRLL